MNATPGEPGDANEETSAKSPSKFGSVAFSRVTQLTALAVLLIGFAVLVAIYMNVVNRYVHYSVRAQASEVVEPGASAALRLTIYRPETLRELRGSVRVSRLDGSEAVEVGAGELSSQDVTAFSLDTPAGLQSELSYRLDVDVVGEEVSRAVEIPFQIARPTLPESGVIGLAPTPVEESEPAHTATGRGHIRVTRSETTDQPIDVTVVAETSYPVRFLENRFLLRVSTPDGTPLSHRSVSVHIPDGEGTHTVTELTDTFGLIELTAEPLDVEMWRVEIDNRGRDPHVVWLEVVPGFDGLILQLPQVIIPSDGPIPMTVVTNLTAYRWYYDLFSADIWLTTGSQVFDSPDHILEPSSSGWHSTPGALRLGLLQVYTAPFASLPQNSIRSVLFRPRDMSDLDAVRQLLIGLQQQEFVDASYATALSRFDRPNASTSRKSLDRLARFLLARLRPAFELAPVRYDDTESQTLALESDTLQFRTRMHWVMGLGVAGLLSWLVLLVLVGTLRTRQRTQSLIEDVSGDGFELRTQAQKPMAGGTAVLVPLLFALVTIAAFFVGVILMLAAM